MKPLPVLHQLEAFPNKPLRFVLDGEQLVPNDFHVTEVKRVVVASRDCGGDERAWQELVVQLWSPHGDHTRTPMTSAKFSSILARAEALDLLDHVLLRFEYGDPGAPAVQYHLGRIDSAGDTVDVHLAPPRVACRPHERERLTELPVLQDPVLQDSVLQHEVCCAPSRAEVCCG